MNIEKLREWVADREISLQSDCIYLSWSLRNHEVIAADTEEELTDGGFFTIAYAEIWKSENSEAENPDCVLPFGEWQEIKKVGYWLDWRTNKTVSLDDSEVYFQVQPTEKLLALRGNLDKWIPVPGREIPQMPYVSGHLDVSLPFGRVVARWVLLQRGIRTESDDQIKLTQLLREGETCVP